MSTSVTLCFQSMKQAPVCWRFTVSALSVSPVDRRPRSEDGRHGITLRFWFQLSTAPYVPTTTSSVLRLDQERLRPRTRELKMWGPSRSSRPYSHPSRFPLVGRPDSIVSYHSLSLWTFPLSDSNQVSYILNSPGGVCKRWDEGRKPCPV